MATTHNTTQHGNNNGNKSAVPVSINNNTATGASSARQIENCPQLWPRLNGIMQKSCLGTVCGDPNTISMRTSSRTGCSWDEVLRCCLG